MYIGYSHIHIYIHLYIYIYMFKYEYIIIREALFKKFMCYCTTNKGDLEGAIATAEAKGPEVASVLPTSALTNESVCPPAVRVAYTLVR